MHRTEDGHIRQLCYGAGEVEGSGCCAEGQYTRTTQHNGSLAHICALLTRDSCVVSARACIMIAVFLPKAFP